MKKILSLLFFVAFAVFANAQVALKGGITSPNTEDYTPNALRFTFENTSGKAIANCNFQIILPDGVSIKKKSNGKYQYTKGDATEDMETFSIAYSDKNGKYTVAVYGGVFDEEAGNCIIELPLDGTLTGEAKVANIAFGDPDENDFEVAYGVAFPDFTIDLTTAINGISADLTKSGVIYNMAGQRVSKATKGIYVVDGKKVAVSK